MRRAFALVVLACATAAAGASAAPALRQCSARSIGPGSSLDGGTTGAACVLAAFRSGCKPAEYVLSSFGVDTAATEDFRVERRAGRCDVVVITSFRVIPQAARVFKPQTCRRVRKVKADIVADRCTAGPPGQPAAVSLTVLR